MGASSTSPSESTASVLSQYAKYLPGLINATSSQIPATAQNQLNATLNTQPLYNALNLQQAQNYSVPLAEVGQDVQRSNALAGANINLEQMQGPGGAAAREADKIARETNPNYYKVQDASSTQAKNLVNSINLNGLSMGEQAAAERSLNQSNVATGNLGIDNATNAVSNAMNFGNAYNQKLGMMGNALGAANGVATSAQNTGFNGVNIAMGQPNASTMSNFGTGQFSNTNAGTQNGSSNNAFNFGGGMLGNMFNSNNALTSAAASQSNATSPAAYLGAVCCFIFLEAYQGSLPSFIRKSRDKYYSLQPDIATGYRRMSSWLVPAMKRYSTVRWLTWHLIVRPITLHLSFVNGVSSVRKGKRTTHFWLRVWSIMGRGHDEKSFCKPWMYPMLKGVK